MTLRNLKTKVIAFGACAIVAGCSVLSPQPDRSEFFILTPVSDSAGMAAKPASASPDSQLTIGVGPVDFPDYLRRLPVVTRVAPNLSLLKILSQQQLERVWKPRENSRDKTDARRGRYNKRLSRDPDLNTINTRICRQFGAGRRATNDNQ